MSLTSKAQKRLFLLGSFVVLLLAVLLYWRINALMQSYSRVDHTNQVELNLEKTLSYLKDAETAQRGFLLTNDSAFLRPYYSAQEQMGSTFKTIRKLTSDNKEQQVNFAALQSFTNQQFYLLDYTLSHARDSASGLYQNLINSKANMDRVRMHIVRMKYIETKLLEQRESLKQRYVRLTPLSLLFFVFAMLAIIGFSYYGLTKQLQQTEKFATDLDHANNELMLKNKQLENSIEELNSFNYIASHDLKEPLRKILFFTDTIVTHDYQLSEASSRNLQKIHASGERMKNLLDDLLTYAQASMTERKIETVDLNVLLPKVLESLSEIIKEKGATINYKNLPLLQAVPSQIEQLFENLISNAVKYSKEQVAPVIEVKSTVVSKQELPASLEATHDWYHQILFSDNGIGFTQDNAEKIFVLFQRLHQRHEFSGTGIGLTICRKIVQNHNGFITVKSEVNNGTTFFIYLPV